MRHPFSSQVAKKSLIALSLFLGVLPGCSKNPAELQKEFMAKGQHYLSQGKTNEAIIEFQNLLKVNPRSSKGRYWLGEAYLKNGWTVESILQFQEAVKKDPLLLPAHIALAQYAVNSGQWTAAKPEIRAILKIDPNNADGWTFSGQRALALGNEEDAQKALDHALTLKPGLANALVAEGDLKLRQKHLNQAKEFYRKALKKDPNNSRAWTGMGYVAQASNMTDEAASSFRQAVKVDHSDLRSRIVLSNFMAQQGHLRVAILSLKAVPKKMADLRVPIKIAEYETLLGENLKAIRTLKPLERQKIPIPDIYFVLAKAYQQSGRRQDALDMVDKLLRFGSIPPVMKIAAARIELSEGRPDEATKVLTSLDKTPNLPISYWETKGQVAFRSRSTFQTIRIINEGLKNFPNNPALLLSLADAQVLGKNFKEAIGILNNLLVKDPKNPAIISRLGTILGRTKGINSEIVYYHDAARKYPDVLGVEFAYLLSLASNKKLPNAISEAKTYLETHQNNQNIRFLLAQFEFQSGHKAQAIELYKSILKSDPKNLQALHALADQDLARQKNVEAESLYRQAIQISPENSTLEVGLGEALLAENQRDTAKEAFQKALSLNPNQPLALLEIAKAEILSGESQQAFTHLTPLLKLNLQPQQKAQILWLWGVAAESNRDFKTALDSFKKAIALAPKNPVYHATLGDLYANLSEWDSALPELNRSLLLQPDNPLLVLTRDWVVVNKTQGSLNTAKIKKVVAEAATYQKSHEGDLHSGLIEASGDLLLKDSSAAQAIFDRLLAKHPGNFLAIQGKSAILLSENHLKQARSLIEKLLASHPDDIQGNLMMASIDQKSGNLRGEVDRLEKVHQANPKWVQPALALAGADLAIGRFEEAKSITFALHEAHPDLLPALYLHANAAMDQKDYRTAMRDFLGLVKFSKKPGPLYNMASVAALKLGDPEKARQYLDLALKSAPDDPAILNNMAFFLAETTKDLSKALDYAYRAAKLAPQPSVQDTVGYVLFRMGRFDQAEPHFKSAYEAHFRDPEFLFHMGLNEWKLGKNNQASDHLRKAVVSGTLTPAEQEIAQKALRSL